MVNKIHILLIRISITTGGVKLLRIYIYIFRFQFVESNNLDLFIWTNMLTFSNLRSEQMEVYFSNFFWGERHSKVETICRKMFNSILDVIVS